MASDEIEAAIERAESKRAELQSQQPEAKEAARLIAALPNAAAEYRKQIKLGGRRSPSRG
jgi:hypothetical protein